MSYSGEVAAGAVVAAAAVPVVIIGGVAMAAASVGKAAVAAGKAAHEAVQQARVDGLNRELGKMTAQANTLESQMHSQMQAAAASCYEDYARTMQSLEEMYQREPDMSVFVAECRAAHRKLCQDIQQKRAVIEQETIAGIQRELKVQQQTLAQKRAEIQKSMALIQNDMERQERVKELASAELQETCQMLEDFRAGYGSSEFGRKAYDACLASYKKATASLEEGLSEAALTQAYSIKDTILLRVRECMEAECRSMQVYADCTAMLKMLTQMMEQQRSIDYTFNETCSGKQLAMHIDDFTEYYRDEWKSLAQQLALFTEQLSSGDFRDYAPEHLTELLDRMGDWQEKFLQETATAYERLHNLLLRKETAKLLVKRYMDMGYQLIPLTEEDKAVSELDSRIIRLEHRDTGERIYLRLNAQPDADGHIAMNISIEDHTEYEGSYSEVELARAQEREANCETLRQSNVGKNLQLKHRCTNPGVLDTYQKPQDK